MVLVSEEMKMQIRFLRFLHFALAGLFVMQSNLCAMQSPTPVITPEEKEKIEAFIKENSKFSERTKNEIQDSKKFSIKPAYWIAGGIAVVLATILITAAYDEKEGKFAARNMLKLLKCFSRAQKNIPAPEVQLADNAQPPAPVQQPQEKPVSTLSHVGESDEAF
jgi:hypothetical protein